MAAITSTRAVGRRIAAVAGGGRSRAPVIGGGDSRKAHSSSSYDKEIEEEVRPAVVPDHVLNSTSKYYWGPHPQTGVFGPETTGGAGSSAAAVKETPAPEQTVRFRSLEDVDKAPYL